MFPVLRDCHAEVFLLSISAVIVIPQCLYGESPPRFNLSFPSVFMGNLLRVKESKEWILDYNLENDSNIYSLEDDSLHF